MNPEKHQAMVLATTNYTFSFPVKNSIELFGMTIDTEMNFKEHLATICNKINSQYSVKTRFGKLVSSDTLLRLYKAFILPHFYYCSTVWHFCNNRHSDKLETLNPLTPVPPVTARAETHPPISRAARNRP